MEEIHVERPAAGVDVRSEEWGAEFAAEDAVLVGFGGGPVAGVEGVRGGQRGEDTDGRGQGPIESAREVFSGDGSLKLEAGDLGEGVDAGVRAA
jgi:hypothetical protein